MTIRASGTVEVAASPQEALELVLDLEAYRLVDPKIRRVLTAPALDAAGTGSARLVGSLWHFPPAPDTHLVQLDRWERVMFTGAPRVFARAIYSFTGRFDAVPVDGGTSLTHAYEIRFRQPLHAAFGAAVDRWLQADLADELGRLQQRLGGPPPA